MFVPRPKQREILAYTGGWMGVSAVPGSGKTETLSRLAAQIIGSGVLASHQEVLIVTLVNSAVDNFYQRIRQLVRESGLLPHISYRVRTLHGLSHDIVRERPELAGLSDDFQILDERAAAEIREEVAIAWLRGHPYDLDEYLHPDLDPDRGDWVRRDVLPALVTEMAGSLIRVAKDRELGPDTLRGRIDTQVMPLPLAEMACDIYADYQRALSYRGAVDFDDLMRNALAVLRTDEDLLLRLRQRWPYVLEDEAQDSSRLQEEILRLLVGDEGNWVRVGDPNQAIYETFTTASPHFLRRFMQEPLVVARELPNSGRSTLSIIALANHLVEWTRSAHPEPAVRNALTPPPIEPTPPGDPQPNPADDPAAVHLIERKYSPEAEIRAVVESLERWLPDHPQSTVAVLVPRNTRGFELVDALRRREIEVVDSLLRSTVSTRQAAGALANLLRYLAEPTSSTRLATVYRVWQREAREDPQAWDRVQEISRLVHRCRQVEAMLWPRSGQDWLEEQALDGEVDEELQEFRSLVQRWQQTILLPIDQTLLTLSQDLFTEPADLAIAHKLAISLRQISELNPEWRLPELTDELAQIARNERRFLGFSEDDLGFDPNRYRGKVVVSTMHKAKGLEWDRVYLMSVNSYDFPSGQPYDQYIGEKWFIRDKLNLEAEALAQLRATIEAGTPSSEPRGSSRAPTAGGDGQGTEQSAAWIYHEGRATQDARLDYVRERLRLLYVGITRARKDLIVTWNSGREGKLTPALPLVALQAFWQEHQRQRNGVANSGLGTKGSEVGEA